MSFRDLDTDTLSDACSKVMITYQIEKVRLTEEDKQIGPVVTNLNEEYDVFISYCHRDMDVAVKIVEQIKQVVPEWKIFFDQNDLRVGTTWQLKLYSSVGKVFFHFLFSPFFTLKHVFFTKKLMGNSTNKLFLVKSQHVYLIVDQTILKGYKWFGSRF